MHNIKNYAESFYLNDITINVISAIIGFFTLFGALSIVERVLADILKRISDKTESSFDDMVFDILMSSVHTVKYLFAFYFSWKLLIVPESFNVIVEQFSSVALLVIVLLFVTKFINLAFTQKLIDESKMKSVSKALLPFVRKTIIALVWVI